MTFPALLLAGLLHAGAAAPEPSWDQLLAETRASHQPIVLDVYTTWCKPCAEMAKNVFPAPEVQAQLKAYRFQKYDAEAGEGMKVAANFGVNSYPTVLVLTPDGNLVRKLEQQDVEGFAKALAKVKPLASVEGPFTDEEEKKHAKDPLWLYVAALGTKRTNPQRAAELFARAEQADPQNQKGVGADAALELVQERVNARMEQAQLEALLEYAMRYPDATGILRVVDGIGALHPEKRGSTQGTYAALAKVSQALVAAKRVDELNGLIYSQLALGDLRGASASADALVKLAPADADRLDTAAEAYFHSGDYTRAVATQTEAVKLKPHDEALKANLARFQGPPEKSSPKRFRSFFAPSAGVPSVEGGMPPVLREMMEMARRVSEKCAPLPRKEGVAMLRLYLKEKRVARAVVLDPEMSSPLRSCLEKAARALPAFEHEAGTKTQLQVRFPVTG